MYERCIRIYDIYILASRWQRERFNEMLYNMNNSHNYVLLMEQCNVEISSDY